MDFYIHYTICAVVVLATLQSVMCIPNFKNPPLTVGSQCRLTEDGEFYSGTHHTAVSNKTCKHWDSVELMDFAEAAFGVNHSSVTKEMKNYCRAIRVAGESDTPREPWCYTSTGKEPCNVPRCSEIMFRSTRQCLLDTGFMSYNGKQTHPDECLRWTDDVVQSVGFELWQFAGAHSWEEKQDYCRNPDNDNTIWCYSKKKHLQDGSLLRLYCNVTECYSHCRMTEGSLEYVGTRSRSETRKPCLPAQDQIPVIFETEEERRRWFEERYVNDDYDIDLTQCRSYPQQVGPSGFNEMGPACYVKHPQTQEVYEETCAIYYCGPTGANFTGDLFDANFFATTMETEEEEDPNRFRFEDYTTDANVSDAWNVLRDWAAAKVENGDQNGPLSLTLGIVVWVITGLILLGLISLDCASIPQIRNRCKSNKRVMSSKMRDLYGSRISLRNNQISPDDSGLDSPNSSTKSQNWAQKSKTPVQHI